MNWKRWEKKPPWPSLRYCPDICLGEKEITRKISVKIDGLRADIWTRDLPSVKQCQELWYNLLLHMKYSSKLVRVDCSVDFQEPYSAVLKCYRNAFSTFGNETTSRFSNFNCKECISLSKNIFVLLMMMIQGACCQAEYGLSGDIVLLAMRGDAVSLPVWELLIQRGPMFRRWRRHFGWRVASSIGSWSSAEEWLTEDIAGK
jgi:hypothetical protein